MSHDPRLHIFKGFDEHSHRRMEQWLEKNYHIHRVRIEELISNINLTNQLVAEFFSWVKSLEENLKLYLQYRYILKDRSLINKFMDYFVGKEEEDKEQFFKKLFSMETELGVLMAATKVQVEQLVKDIPDALSTLLEVHDLLGSIAQPQHIDTSRSETEIISAIKMFLKYSPPFENLTNKMGTVCKNFEPNGNSLSKILNYHHYQLVILAKDNGAIVVTDMDGRPYPVDEEEIEKIKSVVDKFKQSHPAVTKKNKAA